MSAWQGTRGRAFTLVELLVVVSIIALLAALLVPGLRKAREQTRRVVCGTHLRGLGNSWEVYALEFGSPPQLARRGIDINWRCVDGTVQDCLRWERVDIAGFGPETFEAYETANNDGQVWLSACHYRNNLFQVSNPPPSGPLPGHWWNWGLIWASGVVQNPRVFFCPSMHDPLLAWDTSLNPWPPSFETMWRPDHPNWVNHTMSSYERRVGLTGVPWDQIPPQTAIAHDIGGPTLENPRDLAHREGATVAYRDGHVTFIRQTNFVTWWDDDSDAWNRAATHRKLIEYQHWIDRGGT